MLPGDQAAIATSKYSKGAWGRLSQVKMPCSVSANRILCLPPPISLWSFFCCRRTNSAGLERNFYKMTLGAEGQLLLRLTCDSWA